MFCNRCGKIIPPSMPFVNGNCPDWACVKVPIVVAKPKIAVIKPPKTVLKPVKVVLEIPKPVVSVIKRNKPVKVRDIKREMASKFVVPWK